MNAHIHRLTCLKPFPNAREQVYAMQRLEAKHGKGVRAMSRSEWLTRLTVEVQDMRLAQGLGKLAGFICGQGERS